MKKDDAKCPVKARRQRLAVQLEKALALGEQVTKQVRQVNAGQLILPNRLVSIFEPEARPIKRGKAHRETEFGYKIRLTESHPNRIAKLI